MTKTQPYSKFCAQRQKDHQFRILQETTCLPEGIAERNHEKLINFASNDYLGLSQHPSLKTSASDYIARYGTGSTASRLVTGNMPIYQTIEAKLVGGKGAEAALVMNSGYQTNLTVLAALADSDVIGKPITILADRLCHNSLLQGAILSGARLMRFHHNNYEHLKSLLTQCLQKDMQIIIVTESVFGMDGDRSDLNILVQLAEQYGALLYIDEAHATGLFGPDGFGLTSEHKGKIDVVMGTFGKALGSFGSYITCSRVIRDYLIQRCGGFIYSTGLPPSVLGSIDAALSLLPQLHNERAYLAKQSIRLRHALQQQGWDCGVSTTHIIPIILGDEDAATNLSLFLKQNGILAPAIRPPTVPKNTSRLRLSLSALHKTEMIDQLIACMATQIAHYTQSPGATVES